MEEDADIYGNYAKCPECGNVVNNLHQHYDAIDSWKGKTVLENVNEFQCPHCNAFLALVTRLEHDIERFTDK